MIWTSFTLHFLLVVGATLTRSVVIIVLVWFKLILTVSLGEYDRSYIYISS